MSMKVVAQVTTFFWACFCYKIHNVFNLRVKK